MHRGGFSALGVPKSRLGQVNTVPRARLGFARDVLQCLRAGIGGLGAFEVALGQTLDAVVHLPRGLAVYTVSVTQREEQRERRE